MKRDTTIKLFLVLMFVTISTYESLAQVPQAFNYQAVARGAFGNTLVNRALSVKISITDSAGSNTYYSELQKITTNAFGLFSCSVGKPDTVLSGSFSIAFNNNLAFMKVEVDTNGTANNYIYLGTQQLLSVPYAQVAGKIKLNNGNSLGEELVESVTYNYCFDDYSGKIVNVYNSKLNVWTSQKYSTGTASVGLHNSNGNLAFNDYSANIVFVYNAKLNTWTSQNYNFGSTSIGVADSANGNFAFNDYSANTVFVYNAKLNIWSSQNYSSGSTSIAINKSDDNFAFDDYSGKKVYVYNSRLNVWTSKPYNSGSASVGFYRANGNFAFDDYSGKTVYIYTKSNNNWTSQTYNSGSASVGCKILDEK